MSASSVFDMGLLKWAKRLKLDSVQLTMQPQVWCGLSWTTEASTTLPTRTRTRPACCSLCPGEGNPGGAEPYKPLSCCSICPHPSRSPAG